jgi:hypothetical protein
LRLRGLFEGGIDDFEISLGIVKITQLEITLFEKIFIAMLDIHLEFNKATGQCLDCRRAFQVLACLMGNQGTYRQRRQMFE